MTTAPWSKGQPIAGPVVPTIMNCRLPDGERYRARQADRFHRGLFGFVPVTMVRPEDQIFPDLGRGPMRTVVMAGQAWQDRPYIIEVEHDPDIEPDRTKDETRHKQGERVFARRPSSDTRGTGLSRVDLELPADMDCDGNRIELPTAAERAQRRVALLKAIARANRRARHRRVAATVALPAPLPVPLPAPDISLGSRPGDVDWLGRRRVFTADLDCGEWQEPSAVECWPGVRG